MKGIYMQLDLSSYRFIDEPKKLEIKDYEDAIQEFVDIVSKHDVVHSILQAGHIKAPGISDIDFIVLIDDGVGAKSLVLAIDDLFNRNKYIYMHTALVTTKEIFENQNKFFKSGQPRTLFGEEVLLKKVDQAYQLVFLTDLFNELWPNELLQAVTMGQNPKTKIKFVIKEFENIFLPYCMSKNIKKTINVRHNLCKLNNATQSAALLREITGHENQYLEMYSDRILKLRRNWFDMDSDRYVELIDLLNEFPEYCIEMTEEISKSFNENWFQFNNPIQLTTNQGHGFVVNQYFEKIEKEKAIKYMMKYYKKSKIRIQVLGDMLSINSSIRSGAAIQPTNIERFEKYSAILKERDELMNERAIFLRKIGMIGHGNKNLLTRSLLKFFAYSWKIKSAIVLNRLDLLWK